MGGGSRKYDTGWFLSVSGDFCLGELILNAVWYEAVRLLTGLSAYSTTDDISNVITDAFVWP